MKKFESKKIPISNKFIKKVMKIEKKILRNRKEKIYKGLNQSKQYSLIETNKNSRLKNEKDRKYSECLIVDKKNLNKIKILNDEKKLKRNSYVLKDNNDKNKNNKKPKISCKFINLPNENDKKNINNPLNSNININLNNENNAYFKRIDKYINYKKANSKLNNFKSNNVIEISSKNYDIKKEKITLFKNKDKNYVKLLRDYNLGFEELKWIKYQYFDNNLKSIKFLFNNKNKITHLFNKNKLNNIKKEIKFNNNIKKIIVINSKTKLENICFIDKKEYQYDLIDINNKNNLDFKIHEIKENYKIIGFNSYYDINNKLCKFKMVIIKSN